MNRTQTQPYKPKAVASNAMSQTSNSFWDSVCVNEAEKKRTYDEFNIEKQLGNAHLYH